MNRPSNSNTVLACCIAAPALLASHAHAQGCGPTEIYPERSTTGGIATGQDIAAGDVNGDGLLDLVSSDGSESVAVFLNLGGGAFATGVAYDSGNRNMRGVTLADFDNDGALDIAVANPDSDRPQAAVSVLLNNGDGTFGAFSKWRVSDRPEVVAVADIDGDGNADLVVGDQRFSGTAPLLGVRLGRGDGTFAGASTLAASAFPRAIAVADINDDDRPDVVLATDGGVDVFLNDGGALLDATTYAAFIESPNDVELADVDGDGDRDIALVARPDGSTNQTLGTMLNDGTGVFAGPVFVADTGLSGTIGLADIDGDGDLDVADAQGSNTRLWLGDGTGAFTLGATLASSNNRNDLLVADLDGDGDPDAAATGQSVVEVRLNQCVAFPPVITQQPPRTIVADSGTTVRIAVEAGLGTPPLMYQWRRNGVPLAEGAPYSGVNTSELTIDATSEQTDAYDVVVSNASGAVTSRTTVLAVRDTCAADFDGDGSLTIFDFLAFQNAFDAGCP